LNWWIAIFEGFGAFSSCSWHSKSCERNFYQIIRCLCGPCIWICWSAITSISGTWFPLINYYQVQLVATNVNLCNKFWQSNFAPVEEIGESVQVITVEGEIPDDFPEGVYIRNGQELSIRSLLLVYVLDFAHPSRNNDWYEYLQVQILCLEVSNWPNPYLGNQDTYGLKGKECFMLCTSQEKKEEELGIHSTITSTPERKLSRWKYIERNLDFFLLLKGILQPF